MEIWIIEFHVQSCVIDYVIGVNVVENHTFWLCFACYLESLGFRTATGSRIDSLDYRFSNTCTCIAFNVEQHIESVHQTCVTMRLYTCGSMLQQTTNDDRMGFFATDGERGTTEAYGALIRYVCRVVVVRSLFPPDSHYWSFFFVFRLLRMFACQSQLDVSDRCLVDALMEPLSDIDVGVNVSGPPRWIGLV